jgi:RNA polymerase sigma-70 factor (ECF subfamily)
MYHLGRRCAADYFRKSSSAPIAVDPSTLEDHADEGRRADETAARLDDHALLQRALGHLDHDDREVLLLSRLQELSFAEVAGILECSAGAARVRAHRALRTLRDHYFQLQKENPL